MPEPTQPGDPPVVTARQNLYPVPYRGPLPLPARPLTRPLEAVLATAAVSAAVRAALFWQRAELDGQLASGVRRAALADQLTRNDALLAGSRSVYLALLGASAALWLLWRARRRPRRLVREAGESHVEAALNAVVPLSLRAGTGLVWTCGLLLSAGVFAPWRILAADVADVQLQVAAGTALVAVGWLLHIAWIRLATAAIDERLAWSEPYR
jgi:hypothetical protein